MIVMKTSNMFHRDSKDRERKDMLGPAARVEVKMGGDALLR